MHNHRSWTTQGWGLVRPPGRNGTWHRFLHHWCLQLLCIHPRNSSSSSSTCTQVLLTQDLGDSQMLHVHRPACHGMCLNELLAPFLLCASACSTDAWCVYI